MKNEKRSDIQLNQAIFISVALHLLLIVFLVWSGSARLLNEQSNGEAIGAFMIDSAEIKQQYQRIARQTAQHKQAEKNNEILAARQQEELNERQAEDQRRLLEIKRQKLKAQQEEQARKETEKKAAELADKLAQVEAEKQAQVIAAQKAQEEAERKGKALAAQLAKQEAEKKARELADQQAKIEADKKAKVEAEKQAKAKAEAEKQAKAKAEAEKQAKAKAEAEKQAKAKAEAEKQAKAEAEKQAKAKREAESISHQANNALDNILSSKPKVATSASNNTSASNSQNVSDSELAKYKGQIMNAIQNNFRDPSLYRNKTCRFNLKLMPDGKVAQITPLQGDPALCRAAMAAANGANIPKPPNDAIYQKAKNIELLFEPDK